MSHAPEPEEGDGGHVRVPRFTSKIALRRHDGQMSHSRRRA
jgi:hypothetical protein